MSFSSSKIFLPRANWQVYHLLYQVYAQLPDTMSAQVNPDGDDIQEIAPGNNPNDDPTHNLLDQVDEESHNDGDHGTLSSANKHTVTIATKEKRPVLS